MIARKLDMLNVRTRRSAQSNDENSNHESDEHFEYSTASMDIHAFCEGWCQSRNSGTGLRLVNVRVARDAVEENQGSI